MKTEVLPAFAGEHELNTEAIEKAGELLRAGEVVAIPTETVYGLAANAYDGNAVSKIFKAKGRPQDNPLIVHIAKVETLSDLVAEVPKAAKKLAAAFWPGPLTMILPKSEKIPDAVSAGLPTVAVRMPSHPVAHVVIEAAGVPLAAPSANLSGSPSPTNAKYVLEDMHDRIPLILDGGSSAVGVESTVITLATARPRVLRPGGITVEQLRALLGEVDVDDAVLHKLAEGVRAASPGMKYKHYAPRADITIVKGTFEEFCRFVETKEKDAFVLCFAGEEKYFPHAVTYGREDDGLSQANRLFDALRELDEQGANTVYARCPALSGVGLAVYNRLIRAAGFKIVEANNDNI